MRACILAISGRGRRGSASASTASQAACPSDGRSGTVHVQRQTNERLRAFRCAIHRKTLRTPTKFRALLPRSFPRRIPPLQMHRSRADTNKSTLPRWHRLADIQRCHFSGAEEPNLVTFSSYSPTPIRQLATYVLLLQHLTLARSRPLCLPKSNRQ